MAATALSAPIPVKAIWHIAIATRAIDSSVRRFQEHFGIGPWGRMDLHGTARVHGRPTALSVRAAVAQMGFLTFGYDEPLSEPSPFENVLAQRPAGGHHVACLVDDIESGRRQMRDLGYAEILWSDTVGPAADGKVSYFDAREDLGTVVELSQLGSPIEPPDIYEAVQPTGTGIKVGGAEHVAVVVRDIETAVASWARIFGLGPAEIFDFEVPVTYLGETRQFHARGAFLKHKDFVLELAQPISRPSPLQAFLEVNGPGIHHVCLAAEDVAHEAAAAQRLGYRILGSSYGFGPNRDGDSVYLDTEADLGVVIELCKVPSGYPV